MCLRWLVFEIAAELILGSPYEVAAASALVLDGGKGIVVVTVSPGANLIESGIPTLLAIEGDEIFVSGGGAVGASVVAVPAVFVEEFEEVHDQNGKRGPAGGAIASRLRRSFRGCCISVWIHSSTVSAVTSLYLPHPSKRAGRGSAVFPEMPKCEMRHIFWMR